MTQSERDYREELPDVGQEGGTDRCRTTEPDTGQSCLQKTIDKYSDMLFKIAYLRLQSVQDAEDVVQETFYQYLKRTELFSDEEHEKAWLIRVTLNACRKIWRSAWNRHRSDGDVILYEEFADADSEPGPEESLVAADNSRMLLEAVRTLPAKYRDVIHLFYYVEMSVKEIAEATGRRESTVTSQLTRGRELLRKKLKEEYDFA